jgi:hypothetical protein
MHVGLEQAVATPQSVAVPHCWQTPDTQIGVAPEHWPFDVQPAEPAAQTPDTQDPLWHVVPVVQAAPAGAPEQDPLVHGCPVPHAVPQLPQLDGSEAVVSQMPVPHTVPAHGLSVSPVACILYSTRRLASAPVFEGHVEPVRSDALRVAPAANVKTMAPLSDQYCPGVRTRSWPLVPSVKRKTAAGQPMPVGVFAEAAMRKTVIA